jgi:tRNA G18 (ribose-2'-O)-methylase SpoU
MTVTITDAADPRLADYVGLTDPQLRQRVEHEGGFFIVEGITAVERLFVAPQFTVRSFLLTPAAAERIGDSAAARGEVLVAEPALLRDVVGFAIHRGVVASVERPVLPSVETVIRNARLVLVLEGVGDHENLGGLFRNAAAFGVDGVILDPTCADPFYRRAVRVSMGHVLGVPLARSDDWPGTLRDLRAADVTVCALTPAPGSVPLREVTAGEGPVAVLVGAESPGLTAAAIEAATCAVRIPMAPGIDSLNVATASGIALNHFAGPFT